MSQLLLTPALTVDIAPLPEKTFIAHYGVTVDQMVALAEEHFIIPNIYYYRDGGWRDYLPHRQLAQFLIRYGRTNTEWIVAYLQARYGFSAVEDECTEYFRSVPLSAAEQTEVLAACYGRIKTWDRFAAAYGQRLAYIKVLGGHEFTAVVDWIREQYRRPHARVHAIRLLNASKVLVATETTGAYGGIQTDVPETLAEIRQVVSRLRWK